MKTAILIAGILLFLSGCAHILSDEALRSVDPSVEYAQVKADPEAWRGSTLVLGGRIIDVKNEKEGSTLEVLRYFLDRSEEPVSVDEAGGRFLVRTDHFLDPEVFKAGRLVTLTGTVTGSETRRLGEVDYVYPVFRLGELHLLNESYRSYPYPSYYYDYPYFGDPFYDPWYRMRFWPYRYPYYGF